MGLIPGSELFFLVLLPASLFDISRYKVPNALFVPALTVSLIRHLQAQGLQHLYLWLAGIFIPFILCYFFYRWRMLGASDIKMFSVAGSFIGVGKILDVMVISLFVGAVLALLKMIHRKNFIIRMLHLYRYAVSFFQEKKLRPYYDRESEGDDGVIPFSVAISLAVILCVY